MSRCLLWGANSIVFAAFAAHPMMPPAWTAIAAIVAVACWLRGFQVAVIERRS